MRLIHKMIGVLILLIFLLAHVHFSFYGISYLPRTVPIYFLTTATCMLIVAYTSLRGPLKQVSISLVDVAFGIFYVYILLNASITATDLFKNNLFADTSTLFLLYIVFRWYTVSYNMYANHFVLFSIPVIYELILSLLQVLKIISNSNPNYVWGGSFGNPAILAGFLSFAFPYLLYEMIKRRHAKENKIFIYVFVCTFLAFITIFLSACRGAMLGSVCALGISLHFMDSTMLPQWVLNMNKISFKKILVMLTFLLGILFVFMVKKDSTLGRLFIWQTSMACIMDRPWLGSGFGNFEHTYNSRQAEHFCSGKYSMYEWRVADYVETAYNDFIEISVELGFVGLLLFLFILVSSVVVEKNKFSRENLPALASLVAFLVFTMTWFALKSVPLSIYFIFALSVLSTTGKQFSIQFPKYLRQCVHMIFLIGTLTFGFNRAIYTQAYTSSAIALDQAFIGNHKAAIHYYQKSFPVLKKDGLFLAYFASSLIQEKAYQKSAKLLLEAQKVRCNPELYQLMGSVYEALGKFELAKDCYVYASCIIPSRIVPKYLWIKAMLQNGERKAAIEAAKQLIERKEKINSPTALLIKEELRILVQEETNSR